MSWLLGLLSGNSKPNIETKDTAIPKKKYTARSQPRNDNETNVDPDVHVTSSSKRSRSLFVDTSAETESPGYANISKHSGSANTSKLFYQLTPSELKGVSENEDPAVKVQKTDRLSHRAHGRGRGTR
jgi:hypothetical protein